jgi:hypothetical protein
MHVFHFMIPGYEQPAVPVTKADDLGIFYIATHLAIVVLEPFGEPLNRKPGCRQADSY